MALNKMKEGSEGGNDNEIMMMMMRYSEAGGEMVCKGDCMERKRKEGTRRGNRRGGEGSWRMNDHENDEGKGYLKKERH